MKDKKEITVMFNLGKNPDNASEYGATATYKNDNGDNVSLPPILSIAKKKKETNEQFYHRVESHFQSVMEKQLAPAVVDVKTGIESLNEMTSLAK